MFGRPSRLTQLLLSLLMLMSIVAACGDDSPSAPSAPSPAPPPAPLDVPFSTTDLRVGTGDPAANGQTLAVNFTGWLYDENAADHKGNEFDTTTGRGPFTFVLGAGTVIQGWDQGMVGIRVGGLRRLVIPPGLGFGATGSPPRIPPNATLIFEVELLGIG